MSNEKTSVLSNHIHDSNKKKNSEYLKFKIIFDNLNKELMINLLFNLGPKHSIRRHCTSHTTNQRVISSTPIRREFNGSLPFFESYLSPITTSMKYEQQILSTSLFYDEDYDFDVKNVKQNSAYHDNVQTSLLQNTSYLSGFSILNTSQQIFNTEQDIDVTNTKKKNNEHSQMRFIRSKKPKYIQTENSISQLDIDTNVTTEKSLREKSQDNKDMIVYFDHKYESIHEESKTNNSSTSVLKQSLGKEIYKNISYEYLNDSEMSMPHSSTDKNMSKLKKNRSKTKKSISELNISKSWKMIKQTFSDILFSDLDKTVEVVITKKNSLCTNKFHTKIKQDSVKSSQNNISQRYNINYESMDIKSQNNEEENIFSANSFLKMSNQSNYNAKIRFNKPNESSFIFSEDSIFMPNLKNNSDQLNLIKHDRMNGSQDSSSNYENKSINHNRIAGLLNNIKFEDISHIEMDESISVVGII